jgi:hypothetical protein
VTLLLSLLLLSGCDQLPFDVSQFTGGGSSSDPLNDDPDEKGGSSSDASDDAASSGGAKLEVGQTFKAKEKKLILQGSQQGKPPPPAEGISRKQCGDLTDGGAAAGPGCATAEIECGQTIIGHTKGGGKMFNTRFYEKHFCTPATTNHNGGDERVYYARAPEGRKRLWFTLDSPCADLDLAVIKYEGGGECPSIDSNIQDCEMWPKDGRKREIVDVTSTGASDWLAVIEGKDDFEGAFALTLQCVDW